MTGVLESVSFKVFGVPAAQGSMKAFVVAGKGRVTDTSKTGAIWRDAVAVAARTTVEDLDIGGPLDGPLTLDVTFRFPMPASRSKRLRELGTIPKTSAPDASKLVRAVEDACQAVGLIRDDARFHRISASKVETTGWTGATIAITREEQP
jgi:Holliday junction resolvase RusA-like endonuclease